MTSYQKATSWEEAFTALEQPDIQVLAGGTDVYADEKFPQKNSALLDISNLKSDTLVEEVVEGWWLDAQTTWSDVMAADLPPLFQGLKDAACQIGGVQIQNAGTIGGNICNASPAADSVPPLLVLDAKIEIRNEGGTRLVPIADFIIGRRKTILKQGEIVSRLFIPRENENTRSDFIKIGTRAYLVISPVMVAGMINKTEDGTVSDCRIVVGACSEVAVRLEKLEERLCGVKIGQLPEMQLKSSDFEGLSPISDARANAEYRLKSAEILVARLLKQWGAQNG